MSGFGMHPRFRPAYTPKSRPGVKCFNLGFPLASAQVGAKMNVHEVREECRRPQHASSADAKPKARAPT